MIFYFDSCVLLISVKTIVYWFIGPKTWNMYASSIRRNENSKKLCCGCSFYHILTFNACAHNAFRIMRSFQIRRNFYLLFFKCCWQGTVCLIFHSLWFANGNEWPIFIRNVSVNGHIAHTVVICGLPIKRGYEKLKLYLRVTMRSITIWKRMDDWRGKICLDAWQSITSSNSPTGRQKRRKCVDTSTEEKGISQMKRGSKSYSKSSSWYFHIDHVSIDAVSCVEWTMDMALFPGSFCSIIIWLTS